MLAIGLTLAGIPARFRELLANTGQPLLSPLLVSSLILGMNLIMAGLFIGAALWMVRLKGPAPVVLFLSLTLITIGATETGITGALINPQHGLDLPLLRWLVLSLGAVTLTGAMLLLYAFPDGQFVPAWSKWLALIWAGLMLLWLVDPQMPFNPLNGPTWRATPLPSLLVGMVWFGSGLVAQTYRYRRVSGLVERQQLKWTLLGLAGAIAGGVLYYGLLALAQDGRWSGRSGLRHVPAGSAGAAVGLHGAAADLSGHRNHALPSVRHRSDSQPRTGLWRADRAGDRDLRGGGWYVRFHLETHGSLLISLIATGLVAVAFQPVARAFAARRQSTDLRRARRSLRGAFATWPAVGGNGNA